MYIYDGRERKNEGRLKEERERERDKARRPREMSTLSRIHRGTMTKNWTERVYFEAGACSISEHLSIHLSKTNYEIDVRLISCLEYAFCICYISFFLTIEEWKRKRRTERKSYLLQNSRHLWWCARYSYKLYNTNNKSKNLYTSLSITSCFR